MAWVRLTPVRRLHHIIARSSYPPLLNNEARKLAITPVFAQTHARGVTGIAGMAVRRLILLPIAIATAAGAAAGAIKDKIPDIGLPKEVTDIVSGVGGFLSDEIKSWRAVFAETGKSKSNSSSEQSSSQPPPPNPAPTTAATAATAATTTKDAKEQSATPPPPPQPRALTEEEKNDMVIASELFKQLEERVAELEKQILAEREQSQEKLAQEQASHKEEMEVVRRASTLETMRTKPESKRPIDIFSDILDLRAKVDSAFNAHDHLPRVVVVGDQSAGKTSVLEVLVRAHIFPRGHGEMMTRSPIQVTLSPGKQRIASIKGSDRAYDLENNSDLLELRKEIERKMKNSIMPGQAVSNQTLAIDVRGPDLAPMVLVDLPGIIQHHTQGMAASTKTSILEMCQHHISNPNAVILCIQDAMRDAEGSSVADVVHAADPSGARTVFVLTKVDLAEQLHMPSSKVQSILRGERFNVKAKSYFAVVTGTKDPDASIDTIRKSEKEYFLRSQFVRDKVFNSNQAGIDNLSKAVSELFWDRVKETVASETKEVAASLRRKENEWKNTFPNQPRQSRDDLFAIGRTTIMQNMAKLIASNTPVQYEAMLRSRILEKTSAHFLESVYVESAANSTEFSEFKTESQNALDAWVRGDLPQLSVEIARKAVLDDIFKALDIDDAEHTFSKLADNTKEHAMNSVKWQPTAATKLASIQDHMLSDDVIKTRKDWEDAIVFMQTVVTAAREKTMKQLSALSGPTSYQQWTRWKYATKEEQTHNAIIGELTPYFIPNKPLHNPQLSSGEMTTIQHNLQRNRVIASPESIQSAFKLLYDFHFFTRAQQSAAYCRSHFSSNASDSKSPNGLGCADVALFWRYQNMANATANRLRVESMDYREHLKESVTEYVDTLANDQAAKQTLISGKKVALAEEVEILKHIQAKLEAFRKSTAGVADPSTK